MAYRKYPGTTRFSCEVPRRRTFWTVVLAKWFPGLGLEPPFLWLRYLLRPNGCNKSTVLKPLQEAVSSTPWEALNMSSALRPSIRSTPSRQLVDYVLLWQLNPGT